MPYQLKYGNDEEDEDLEEEEQQNEDESDNDNDESGEWKGALRAPFLFQAKS